jgi:predicted transcriptional regulator
MVNTRRSELEIIEDILNLSKKGAKTTELLYQCNLSYSQCKNYLNFLIEKNIIKEDKVPNGDSHVIMFNITPKGKNFLEDIKKTLGYIR